MRNRAYWRRNGGFARQEHEERRVRNRERARYFFKLGALAAFTYLTLDGPLIAAQFIDEAALVVALVAVPAAREILQRRREERVERNLSPKPRNISARIRISSLGTAIVVPAE